MAGSTTLTVTPAPPGTTFPQRATIFPITNAVSGMTGTITSVSVRLNGLSHTDPDDLDMLLVSPDGRAFVFWSDIGGIRNTFDQTTFGGTNVCRTQTAAGGACSISNFTITVADNGATRLPDGAPQAGRDTRVLVNNTTYQPANGEGGFDAFSNTSPAFNAGVTLSLANYAQNTSSTSGTQLGGTGSFANLFNGSANVNGDWKLYIALDSCCFADANGQTNNDVGSLTSWSLIITTATNNAATSTSLTSSNNPSLLPNNNSVTFTAAVVSGGNPVTLGTVDFLNAGVAFATGVAVNGSGQASTTVTNLNERTHAITAVYSGATGFGTSTGNLLQTVNRATTVTGNTFCNTGPIAIPATFTPSPASTPYPSNLFVTGLAGSISKVTLDLKNYNLTAPSDADVLLVGPDGQKFLPFSFIGGASPAASGVNFTLDDTAASALPSTGGVSSGTFRPAVHNTLGVSFPTPAPAGPHAAAAPIGTATFANTFGGLNPIGTWKLFVSTHGGVNAVSNFNGGWCLTFTTSGDPATTTTPSVNPSPSAANQSTTVAALVINTATSTPVNARGAVSFFENSTLLAGPINVGSTGIASFPKSDFTEGAHFVDANYSGAPGFFNLSTGRVLHYVDAPTTNPSAGRFCNVSPVSFPNTIGASGNPYPTRVDVSGLAGVVSNVTLALSGLSHNFPKDMDMMLTGPNGNSLVVLSDVGGTAALTTPVNLVLDSNASVLLPAGSALSSGTFRPNDLFDGVDNWAPPAPTTNRFLASSASFADAFANSNPNGRWTLWTTNDGAGGIGGGSLGGGWCLNVTMAPPQLTIAKTHSGNFTQGQTGATYTVTVGSSGPGATAGTITVVDTVPAGLTVTGMAGSGWSCSVSTRTCTTTAVIAANASLPPITVTVAVASNATSPLVNSVAVSGGGATGASANDSTIITATLSAVTINVPAGISYSFNGQSVTGSQSFNVAPGNYVLATTTPQALGAGSRAVFVNWSNGQAIAQIVTVGSSALTITGNFTAQFQLTMAASPANGGNVTPASGTFFDFGTVVNATATPTRGFTFASWTGPVANASAAATTVTMDAAKSVTANFTSNPVGSPNVTAQLTITLGATAFNRGTGRFSQTVTISNNGSALPAAAFVVDNLAAGYTMFTPSGFTALAAPAGVPYRELGAIGAGASITITLEFTRVGSSALTYTPRVLGAGAR